MKLCFIAFLAEECHTGWGRIRHATTYIIIEAHSAFSYSSSLFLCANICMCLALQVNFRANSYMYSQLMDTL